MAKMMRDGGCSQCGSKGVFDCGCPDPKPEAPDWACPKLPEGALMPDPDACVGCDGCLRDATPRDP